MPWSAAGHQSVECSYVEVRTLQTLTSKKLLIFPYKNISDTVISIMYAPLDAFLSGYFFAGFNINIFCYINYVEVLFEIRFNCLFLILQ